MAVYTELELGGLCNVWRYFTIITRSRTGNRNMVGMVLPHRISPFWINRIIL